MAVDFRILPDSNVVLVFCSGHVTVAETLAAFDRYTSSPDFRPGQSQLIDLSDVEAYERDFTRIMSLQAHQTEAYFSNSIAPNQTTHLIYVAPNELSQTMAMSSLRSWRNLPGIVPLVVQSLDDALEILSLEVSVQEARQMQAS